MRGSNLFVVAGISREMQEVIGESALARLREAHPLVRVEILDDPEPFAAFLPGADGAMVLGRAFRLPSDVFAPQGRLRWVQSIAAGIDAILTPELRAAEDVILTATKGPMGPSIAEHAVLLMLALSRDLPGYLQDQAERRWRTFAEERPMAILTGKTIAILGVGSIGTPLARMCKLGFGMQVLGFTRTRRNDPHVDRYLEPSAMPKALGEADFVVLCLALTAETARIIDRTALASMKPTAYLINVARGSLVDEVALVETLQGGRIAGAGLDVMAVEPLPVDSPLWGLPNVVLTPHIAPARKRLPEQLVGFWCENIRRFAEGLPLQGYVDRQAGY